MSVSINGQGPREKVRTPKLKGPDSPFTPTPISQIFNILILLFRCDAMIYEALSTLKDPNGSDISAIVSFIEQRHDVATNSKRVLGGRLRRLLQQGKIEKGVYLELNFVSPQKGELASSPVKLYFNLNLLCNFELSTLMPSSSP
nr:telomere repeat-binding factor 4-like [Tanacetum cinerariifolium]